MRRLIGTTLDKYEVLQKVGEGGMATVYRGRHNTLNRDVAIKVLHPHLSSSTRNRKRFAREARAIEHLRHDNILEIFDYSGLDAHECYIITEYVEGETLSALLRRRGRLPSEVATIIGIELARALEYAHYEGILHRDLKPDNVMIRWDGTVKLMDFGIARFLNESQVTMTGALVGSPAFMSPEQASEAKLDHRSDLFSLGTVLYHLVTGHLPFSGSNPSLILKNVIESNRPGVTDLAPNMSAALADVIERLMATHPEDRQNGAREVVEALEACLAESNVSPEDSRWSLRAYLEESEAYEERLDEHLRQILIIRGRQRLDSGDHLAALRLFNRLLSIDEDNEEVLQLVQGLHGEPRRGVNLRAFLGLGVAMVLLAGAAWMATALYESGLPAVQLAQVVDAMPEPSPSPEIAPEPDPAPSVEPAPVDPEPTPEETAARRPRIKSARPVLRRPHPEPVLPVDALTGQVKIKLLSPLTGVLYMNGEKVGDVRDYVREPIPVPVGELQLEVQGDNLMTWKRDLVVGAGEVLGVDIELEARPVPLTFRSTDYADDCQVYRDNNLMGSLDQLGYTLDVKRPDESHLIQISCPDGSGKSQRYEFMRPGETFPPPSG